MEKIPRKVFTAMWSQTASGQENHVIALNHSVLSCKYFVKKLSKILFFKILSD